MSYFKVLFNLNHLIKIIFLLYFLIQNSLLSLASVKFIRIEIPGSNKILSLAEVEVFVNDKNIATLGKATQSAVDFGGVPERAIDGNTNGDFGKATVSSTPVRSVNPYWQLELAYEVQVNKIIIWNRTDCCVERLSNFKVLLLDSNKKIFWSKSFIDPPKPSLVIENIEVK